MLKSVSPNILLQPSRRDLLRLSAVAGIVFASGLPGYARAAEAEDFYFVQLTDLHWGFDDPKVNPESKASLEKAIAAINAVTPQPDFIVFTGDLTHMTKDGAERRRRMTEVKSMLAGLKTTKHVYLAGEHDAAADFGAAFRENFGVLHQSFDHKGVHFITLDNVSDPSGTLGDAQLAWLASDLKGRDPKAPIVVLTHRPLFDLKPDWDWFTGDGAKAIALLQPFASATVFYGHIHQENKHATGNVTHIAARSAMYPLPAPGSVPKKAPLPWNPDATDHGIGWRSVGTAQGMLAVEDHPTI
ncbi:MAG TPA: metallophosphoesterase [Dongiaceae bacterium]